MVLCDAWPLGLLGGWADNRKPRKMSTQHLVQKEPDTRRRGEKRVGCAIPPSVQSKHEATWPILKLTAFGREPHKDATVDHVPVKSCWEIRIALDEARNGARGAGGQVKSRSGQDRSVSQRRRVRNFIWVWNAASSFRLGGIMDDLSWIYWTDVKNDKGYRGVCPRSSWPKNALLLQTLLGIC